MAKRNSLYTITADLAAGTVLLAIPGDKPVLFKFDEATPAMQRAGWANGFKQKLSDAGAIEAGDNGRVDPATKIERVRAMAERLARGVWNERARGGMTEDAVLFAALRLAYTDKTDEQISRYMDGLSAAAKRTLLNQKSGNRLAVFVDRVRADVAAQSAINGDELLGGLDDAE